MKSLKIIGILSLSFLAVLSCVYTYEASVPQDVRAMLVVEGDIIANGTTRVRLSRSMALGSATPAMERGALVYIEDEQGGRYEAGEKEPGVYEAETQGIDIKHNYRLYIELANNKTYASAYVPVNVSPPIDSVNYVVNAQKTGVDFFVSTHNPLGNSRYYKWEFIEDWEFSAEYNSNWVFDIDTKTYRGRLPEESLFYCWTKGKSTGILIDNSSRLLEDVVTGSKIATIWEYDQRATVLYCMQVTQKVLTKEGYTYWEQLRKNTEDMGGVFSVQPSELYGNIVALDDPNEVVLGFISASTVTYSERVFFPGGILKRQKMACGVSGIPTTDIQGALSLLSVKMVPIGFNDQGEMEWAPDKCADCRTSGSKEKPSWWPNSHI